MSPYVSEVRSEGSILDERKEEDVEETERGVRLRPRGETSSEERSCSPRRGLNTYLSRFDDAMKLRGQLANEKASQENGAEVEEFDSFRLFRLLGSVVLAVCVRVFVCHYLVRVLQRHFIRHFCDCLVQVRCLIIYLIGACPFLFPIVYICTLSHTGACLHGVVQILPKGETNGQ